jgi:hypothetical protein
MLSGEATNTNFIVFCLTRLGLEPTIYRTRGKHVNIALQNLGQKDIFQDIWIERFISQDFWISTGNQDYNSSYPCQNGTRKSNRKKASFSRNPVK